jgi:DNA-binding transcriptional ArsR family regulator
MSKYKKVGERIVEDFVTSLFKAIGTGLRPKVLKILSKKDPKIAQLVQDLEKSRAELDKHVKSKTQKSSLSKADKKALNRGEWPFK